MKIKFIYLISIYIIIIFYANQPYCQTNSWSKIKTTQENKLTSWCSDEKGNYYLTFDNIGRIVKANIYNGRIELLEKPIINQEQKYGILLYTGFNEAIYFLINGNVYSYQNYTFDHVLSSDGMNGNLSDPKTTYYNTLGEMFSVEFSYVYKYNSNWKINSLKEIYNNNNTANLYAPFFYVPDTNYFLVYLPENNKNNIININTNTGSHNTILSFDAPINVGQFSILERDGRFYIPTAQELFYFSDFGKKLIVPLIDTLSNGNFSALVRGKNNQELVAYKGDKFYVSYDDCKTWFKPISLNSNFPIGRLNQLVVWDSLHAIAIVQDGCAYEHFYLLDGINKEWRAFNFNLIDNLNIDQFEIDENGNYLGVLNDCRRYFSKDKGLNWELIPRVNKQDNQTYPTDFTFYQSTEKNDLAFYKDSLFETADYGNTWNPVSKLPSKTKRLIYLGNGKMLIRSDSNNTNIEYYMSYDYGKTHQLKYIDKGNIFDSNIFELDHNNNIISHSYTNYYLSTDDGKTWNIDDRFQGRTIRHLEYSNNGTYYLTTKINNTFALYSTKDFINFKNLTSGLGQFYNITFNVHKNQNKIVLSTYNKPDEFNIYYSDDEGNQWNQINYDIASQRGEDRIALVNFSNLDINNNLLICLANDGLYKLSQPLNATDVQKKLSFGVFPNPTADCLMTKVPESFQSAELQYEISDLLGNVVLHQTHTGSAILNLSQLLTGTYILKVSLANQRIYSDKILKY